VKSRKLRYFGHTMRGEDKSLEKVLLNGFCPAIEKEEDQKQRG